MTSRTRLIVGVVLSIVLVTGGTILAATTAAAVSVYRAGTFSVSVQEAEGGRTSLSLPASLVDVGLGFVPDEVYEEIAREAGPHWPVLEALSRELNDCPDAVFVEVVNRHESVRVAKQGRSIVIDIDGAHENIHVALPLPTFTKVVKRIERATDRI